VESPSAALARVFCSLVRGEVDADQGILLRTSQQNNVPAVAPISPVRAAIRNELLPAETHTPVASLSGARVEFGSVNEFVFFHG